MLKKIDTFLNGITMYRLVLNFLMLICTAALILSVAGVMPYSPLALLFSIIFITSICWVTNALFAYVFQVPTNAESIYITALILVLIISPVRDGSYIPYLALAFWAAVWSMASKYIFAIKRKHLFNPAASAVALTSLVLSQPATWWVGTAALSFFVFIGGFLIVRKIRRVDLVLSFMLTAVVGTLLTVLFKSPVDVTAWEHITTTITRAFLYSPLLFFAFIMLTEPLTTPPTRKLRILYGSLVGIFFIPSFHIGSFHFTPEFALLLGNIVVYLVSPKQKLLLTLATKKAVAHNVMDFHFSAKEKVRFKPGQYMEWTLARPERSSAKHPSDMRGNRRYFTIASSPTEEGINVGVKFYEPASTFKKYLHDLEPGDRILASQVAGDFTLPLDPKTKLAFISGGIGVTPFRSMIKYLLDKNEQRSIVHLYSTRTVEDVAYKDIFDQARNQLGIKTLYSTGRIDEEVIEKKIPDYKDRIFYLSGPQAMVVNFEEILKKMGLPKNRIKKDYFPGFA